MNKYSFKYISSIARSLNDHTNNKNIELKVLILFVSRKLQLVKWFVQIVEQRLKCIKIHFCTNSRNNTYLKSASDFMSNIYVVAT